MNGLVRMLFWLGILVLPGLLRRVQWKPGRTLPSAQVVLSEAVLWTHLLIALGLFLVGVMGLGVGVELILLGPAWLGWAISPVGAISLGLGFGQARQVVRGWQARERRRLEKRMLKVANLADSSSSSPGLGPGGGVK